MEDHFWRYSFREIRSKVQIKFGHMCVGLITQYNTLAEIVSQALGGGSSSQSQAPAAHADVTGGVDRAVSNLNSLLTF